MMQLDRVADRQSQWSESARQMRAAIDRARRTALILSIMGAVAGAVASQLPGDAALASAPRTWVALVGVICLAVATFLSARFLGTERLGEWVRARAIAERLKREAFRFATGAAPYDDADRDKAAALLGAERRKIEAEGDELVADLHATAGKGSAPRAPLTPDEYLQQRVDAQIDWYRPKAIACRKAARSLRQVEMVLALLATVTTAVAGLVGKLPLGDMTFDLAALTAVLTTIGAAVIAHVEASRFDYLALTYMATARKLEDFRDDAADQKLADSPAKWSAFVNACEDLIAAENASWIAKSTPPKTG